MLVVLRNEWVDCESLFYSHLSNTDVQFTYEFKIIVFVGECRSILVSPASILIHNEAIDVGVYYFLILLSAILGLSNYSMFSSKSLHRWRIHQLSPLSRHWTDCHPSAIRKTLCFRTQIQQTTLYCHIRPQSKFTSEFIGCVQPKTIVYKEIK